MSLTLNSRNFLLYAVVNIHPSGGTLILVSVNSLSLDHTAIGFSVPRNVPRAIMFLTIFYDCFLTTLLTDGGQNFEVNVLADGFSDISTWLFLRLDAQTFPSTTFRDKIPGVIKSDGGLSLTS